MLTPRFFTLLVLVLAATWPPSAAAEPSLVVRDSGRIAVRWDGPCVVRYDAEGRRRSAEPDCSQSQRARSDGLVRRHMRTAASGAGGGGRTRAGDPTIERQGDRIAASYPDGCRIDYDREGRRRDANRSCSGAQLQKGDRQVRAQVAGSGGGGGPTGPTADPRFEHRGGGAVASFPNGCRAEYAGDGRRREANRACSQAQLQRADRRAPSFLGLAGSGSGTGGGGPDFLNRNGRAEAVYGDGCRVFYDVDGRRTDSNRLCSPSQVQRADRRIQEIWSRPGGAGRAIGKPLVFTTSYSAQARFPDGCNVNFDADRRIVGESGPCSRAHRDRAAQELRGR